MDHDGSLGDALRVAQFPVTLFVDADGRDRRPDGSAQRGRAAPPRRRVAGVIAGRSTPTSSGWRSCAAWWRRSTRAGSCCCRRTCCSSSACRPPSRRATSERRCAGRSSSARRSSAGFVAVFLVVGIVTETIDSWLLSNAKYATVVIGVTFVVLGVAMLAGYRPRFATPHLDAGGRTRSVGSMFVYGIAYAVASLGCTMPLFLSTVFGTGRREGFAAGVANAVFYGAGMGLVVDRPHRQPGRRQPAAPRRRCARRCATSTSSPPPSSCCRGSTCSTTSPSSTSGGDTSSITDSVQRFQSRVSTTLGGRWELIAIVLAAVVGGGARVRRPGGRGRVDAARRAE